MYLPIAPSTMGYKIRTVDIGIVEDFEFPNPRIGRLC